MQQDQGDVGGRMLRPVDPGASRVDDADLAMLARGEWHAGVRGDGRHGRHSRHDLEWDVRLVAGCGFFAQAAEQARVALAQTHDGATGLRRVDHQPGPRGVRQRGAVVADADDHQLGPWTYFGQHGCRHVRVVNHDVGSGQQLLGPHGQQQRVARAGAHERDAAHRDRLLAAAGGGTRFGRR